MQTLKHSGLYFIALVFSSLVYSSFVFPYLAEATNNRELHTGYSRMASSRPENAPSYIPNQYYENENLFVKGRIVRNRTTNEYIAPVGYGIGRMPPKSSYTQFNPQKIRRRSGFGLGRASFGGGG